ncbi:hypothetical protein IEQ34_022120 [Dendrobium chrysotoxum]|uniref:Pectinesterase n=1 Tax=Dendrobium chrysotoxum TaxID=161865 RepID=A0AAV7FK02_DENCH|nr:hypothetical protein IEQ34_022120 [Dendrobium chrysotoxum]
MLPFYSLFTLLHLLPTAALAGGVGGGTTSPCEASCHPTHCKSFISNLQSSSIPHDNYSLAAVDQSLTITRSTAHFLNRAGRAGPAVEDCLELTAAAADDLELVKEKLMSSKAIKAAEADDVMTLMSAVVAGAGSCLDGLEEVGMAGSEVFRRVEAAKLVYGVAIGLVERRLASMAAAPAVITNGPPTNRSSTIGSLIINIPFDQTVTVAKDGSGNFTSVNGAITFASHSSRSSSTFFKIIIKPGIYVEHVVVPKRLTGLVLEGAGMRQTFITGNRSAGDGYTTYQTATFAVNGDRFIATGITFENTALPQNKQAVAVRNSADRSIFYKCRFISFQDTLYAHSNRHLYLHSTIHGTVDFIFGRAAAVFQFCEILPRRPLPKQINTITAQGKDCPSIRSGFSIHLSWILPGKDLIDKTDLFYTYLGRPWKNYSTTVFMQCYMDGFVRPEGWVEWGEEVAPRTIYYGEFENYGGGAGTDRRVRWEGYRRMGKEDAERFTVGEFIGGDEWIWNHSVPYRSGLLDSDNIGRE